MSESVQPTSSETGPTTAQAVSAVRVMLGLSGALSLVMGILVVAWPGRTAAVVAGLIAVYAFIAGLVYAGIAIFGSRKGGWWRLGYLLLAAVYIVAAVLALSNLRATAAFLAVFLGIMIGAVWVIQGAGSIALSRYAPSRGWAITAGLISIVAGILLLISPLLGAAVLWWLLGISLIVVGITQVVQAFTFGRDQKA